MDNVSGLIGGMRVCVDGVCERASHGTRPRVRVRDVSTGELAKKRCVVHMALLARTHGTCVTPGILL